MILETTPRVFAIAAIAIPLTATTLAAQTAPAANPAASQGIIKQRIVHSTTEIVASQAAAEELAERFSGGPAPGEAPAPIKEAAIAPAPEETTPAAPDSSLMAALSERAREVSAQAAENETLAKAAADDARRKASARKKAAKRTTSPPKPSDAYVAVVPPKPKPRAPATNSNGDKDEPNLFAKIFDPSSWSLPKPAPGETKAADEVRTTYKPDGT